MNASSGFIDIRIVITMNGVKHAKSIRTRLRSYTKNSFVFSFLSSIFCVNSLQTKLSDTFHIYLKRNDLNMYGITQIGLASHVIINEI